MKASAVYRKAAELVDSGKQFHSCIAVKNASGGSMLLADDYARTFGFSPFGTGAPSANDKKLWIFMPSDEADEFRVLALLLMSEIAKDSE